MAARTSLILAIMLFVQALLAQVSPLSPSELDPQVYLLKIRSRLIGDWPTPQDWSELESAKTKYKCNRVSCLSAFFDSKIQKYMSTSTYISNMTLKVDELFWTRSAPTPDTLPLYLLNNSDLRRDFSNAFGNLVRRVFHQNLSWDDLYLADNYVVYKNPYESESDELKFYKAKSDDNSKNDYQEINLAGNPNVAGVFTTPKFLDRFWNSGMNQNRKRAAAVFRIMLCDPMVPAIERASMAGKERSRALGITIDQLNAIHEVAKKSNQHVRDPSCNKCHRKLEPMTWTLRGIENGMSSKGTPGYLELGLTDVDVDQIKTPNFRSIIQAATKQDRYLSCQVNHFFKWIVGNDVPLSIERRKALQAEFNSLGRRTNDFIQYLLKSDEFLYGREKVSVGNQTPEVTVYSKAQAVFNRCNECHNNLPFAKDEEKTRRLIFRIGEVLDLKNNGAKRIMPPSYHDWQPSSDDIQSIKAWVTAGSPDAAGNNILHSISEEKSK